MISNDILCLVSNNVDRLLYLGGLEGFISLSNHRPLSICSLHRIFVAGRPRFSWLSCLKCMILEVAIQEN